MTLKLSIVIQTIKTQQENVKEIIYNEKKKLIIFK